LVGPQTLGKQFLAIAIKLWRRKWIGIAWSRGAPSSQGVVICVERKFPVIPRLIWIESSQRLYEVISKYAIRLLGDFELVVRAGKLEANLDCSSFFA
jgi:hypothetical protein